MRYPSNAYLNPDHTPYHYQWEGIKALLNRKSKILGDDTGLGKGQAKSQLILTPYGWRRMGDLKIGDLVTGKNGKPTTITGVFSQPKQMLYKITFDDGFSTLCDGPHLWAVKSKSQKFRNNDYIILTTEEMYNNYEKEKHGVRHNLNKKYKFNTHYLNKDGSRKWHIPLVDPVEFASLGKLPIQPYLLGLLLGDGAFTRGTPSICKLPVDLKEFMKYCNTNDTWGAIQKCSVSLLGGHTREALKELKLWGLKSTEKFIPDIYKHACPYDRLELLRGWMDTDGSPITASGGGTEGSTSSKRLADDFCELVHMLGGIVKLRDRVPSYTYKGEKLEGRKSYRLNIKLPNGENPFKLKRKADLYQKPEKYSLRRMIKDIQPSHEEESVCISVSAKDKLYVIEHGIVTHNTIQSIYAFTFFLEKYPRHKCVVLCEKSTVYQWKSEFERFTVGLNVQVITADEYKSFDKRVKAIEESDADVLILTYSVFGQKAQAQYDANGKKLKPIKILPSANKMLNALRKKCNDEIFLICDEPNLFKNVSTDIHKILRYLSNYCVKIIGLTAMIFENRLEEAYGIVKVIDKNIFQNKEDFIRTYCKWWEPRLGVKVITGYKNLSHFKQKMSPLLIRRGYDDPGIQQAIPEEREVIIEVELNKKHSALIDDARNGIISTYDGMKEVEALAALTWQQKLVNNPNESDDTIDPSKLFEIAEFLNTQLTHDRVLVFSRFAKTINDFEIILKNVFTKSRFETVGRITGKESAEKRSNYQKMFSDPSNDAAVLLVTSAGAKGLNLQAGRILVFIDNPWGYGTDRQLLGRLKRTGSKHSNIIVYRFLAKLHNSFYKTKTIDHAVLDALHYKKKLFDTVDELDIDTDFTNMVFNSIAGDTA